MPTRKPFQQQNNNEDSEQQVSLPRTRSRQVRDLAPASDLRGAARERIMQAGQAPQGQQVQNPPAAWEEFLDALGPFLDEVGEAVRVQERAGWVKIENPLTGHKLYFNKGITAVTRIESSLPPAAVKGAMTPEFYNGRITSIIPAEVQAVGEAIRVIAQVQDRLSAPRRRTRDLG